MKAMLKIERNLNIIPRHPKFKIARLQHTSHGPEKQHAAL